MRTRGLRTILSIYESLENHNIIIILRVEDLIVMDNVPTLFWGFCTEKLFGLSQQILHIGSSAEKCSIIWKILYICGISSNTSPMYDQTCSVSLNIADLANLKVMTGKIVPIKIFSQWMSPHTTQHIQHLKADNESSWSPSQRKITFLWSLENLPPNKIWKKHDASTLISDRDIQLELIFIWFSF